jgi:hypothetical protein
MKCRVTHFRLERRRNENLSFRKYPASNNAEAAAVTLVLHTHTHTADDSVNTISQEGMSGSLRVPARVLLIKLSSIVYHSLFFFQLQKRKKKSYARQKRIVGIFVC